MPISANSAVDFLAFNLALPFSLVLGACWYGLDITKLALFTMMRTG